MDLPGHSRNPEATQAKVTSSFLNPNSNLVGPFSRALQPHSLGAWVPAAGRGSWTCPFLSSHREPILPCLLFWSFKREVTGFFFFHLLLI